MSSSTNTRQWTGLVAIALGVALIVIDTVIVNVITPSVIDDLHISSTQTQWVQESYAIVFAALLLVAGRLSDLLGARRVFAAGTVVFGATSLFAGLASSGDVLILARFLQGVGGAMLLPTSLSLVNQTFTGKARGQAFAVWGATIGAATAIGPIIGGLLAEHASWRWAFGVNVPIVIVVFAMTLMFIDPSARRPGRLDVTGSITSVIALAALAFALVEGRTYGWVVPLRTFSLLGADWSSGVSVVFVALVVAAAFLAMFVWRQRRLTIASEGSAPLMNTGLFAIASFRNGNVATLIIGIGEFGVLAVLPLWLQFTLGYSPVQAGLTVLALAVGTFLASGLSFGLAEKAGALVLVRIGLVVEAAALVAIGLIVRTDSAWWTVVLPLFVYGIGVGFATAQVTNVVLADVPEDENGQASGVQSAFRQLGSALGIAALTTIFYSILSHRVTASLTAQGGVPHDRIARTTAAITDSAGAAIDSFAQNPATRYIAHAGQHGMTSGVAITSYAAAAFLVLGVLSTALIPKHRADPTGSASAARPVAEPAHR